MITTIFLVIWLASFCLPLHLSMEKDIRYPWVIWILFASIWIIPIFTGINVKNNEGQYKGYVTSVEQNGAIFKGWNAYLKTELESSDVDIACIDRENQKLIQELRNAQEIKKNITVKYEGIWQYKIGECPKSDWMIKEIIK